VGTRVSVVLSPGTRPMSLQQRLMADLRAAMRQGDVPRKEAIRLLRAAVLNEEIERRRPLTDDEALIVVERLVKRHQDSIDQFRKGRREDLVAYEQAQLAAIKSYLPERLPREEIEARVRAAIEQAGASSRADTGKVMQQLAAGLRGRADLKEVSRLVQERLGA
jgi:uncharacterized protein YqeY